MSNSMWGGAFTVPPSDLMKKINASIDFDKALYKQDIKGSIAHADMLSQEGIISVEDFAQIKLGLIQIQEEIESGKFTFSHELEDIHMNVESRLSEIIGEPAKRLHTGRSRNDQVATDCKLHTVESFEIVVHLLQKVLDSIAKKAQNHIDDIMPAFTHLQIAQPVSVSHYLLAYFEMFKRDLSLAKHFHEETAEHCPLGAGALAGTTYPIDRHKTASLLGFKRPTANSLDTVSDRDFALDFLYLASKIAVHISRFAEEMIIFATNAFGFVKFSDAFSTGSSMMPQKKNPDAAELLRSKSGRMFANLQNLLVVMKGLPLAYSKDMQEDKEPLFDSIENIILSLQVLDGIVNDITFNTEKMFAMAQEGHSNATDLADYLVQKCEIPFRDAHHTTGKIVRLALEKSCKIHELELATMQSIEPKISHDVLEYLDTRNVVKRRNSFGGTGFDQVSKQVQIAIDFTNTF